MIAWAMAMADPSPAELFRTRYAVAKTGTCAAAAPGCGDPGLPLLDGGPSGVACLQGVLPSIRVRRPGGDRWAIRVTFVIRELDAQGWAMPGGGGRVSGMVLAPDESVQDLCVEPIHTIGRRTLQVRIEVPEVDLAPATTARLDGRWVVPGSADAVLGAMIGGLLFHPRSRSADDDGDPVPAASGAGGYFQSGKLIDWLFGAGSNELVRLTVRSRQPRAPLLIRERQVGVTDKTVLVARDILGDMKVGVGPRAVKLNDCRQIANRQGLIVDCP